MNLARFASSRSSLNSRLSGYFAFYFYYWGNIAQSGR